MNSQVQGWQLEAKRGKSLKRLPMENISSLDEGTKSLPGGGYTTFRTFGRCKVMRIANHYNRLEETAILSEKPIKLDRARTSKALHKVLSGFPAALARVRMILDLERSPGDIYFLIEELQTPSDEQYDEGVGVLTRAMQRENPKAKLTGFIETATAVRFALPAGINEILMIGEEGYVLEGTSSNFFGVRDKTVVTAEEGVLSGITRQMVLEEIARLGIPLDIRGLPAKDLSRLEEAFITSASRGVLPVTRIDGSLVGDGNPGPVTRMLREAYQARIEEEIEEI